MRNPINFIFYKLELGVIANIESWENDFEYEYGLKSFSYSYSLLMLTSSIVYKHCKNSMKTDGICYLEYICRPEQTFIS